MTGDAVHIDAPGTSAADALSVEVRALLLAMLTGAANEARGAVPSSDDHARAQGNAQWWWFDDARGDDVWGSARWCCAQLEADYCAVRARLHAELVTSGQLRPTRGPQWRDAAPRVFVPRMGTVRPVSTEVPADEDGACAQFSWDAVVQADYLQTGTPNLLSPRLAAKRRTRRRSYWKCRATRLAEMRAYYQTHREREIARRLAYQRAHPEWTAAAGRRSYARHRDERQAKARARYRRERDQVLARERVRAAARTPEQQAARAAYYKRWQIAHAEQVKAYQRAYRKNHPEKVREWQQRTRDRKAERTTQRSVAA